MDDSEEKDENTPKSLIFDDDFWAEKQRQFNVTDRQAAFVRALVENPGLNRTQAARKAGYSGNEDSIRVGASRTWATTKVRALFSAVLGEQDLKQMDVATRDEVLRWASNQLRAGIGQAQQKSAELLLKYHDTLDGQTRNQITFPDLLTRICQLALTAAAGNPYFVAAAIFSAERFSTGGDRHCRDWRPPANALGVLKLYPRIIESLEDRHARYLSAETTGTPKNGGAASRAFGDVNGDARAGTVPATGGAG